MSWFTIMYPDSKGKARGQFGDAHCVFDCKYSLYNPRLDAITYYHMINSLTNKKFQQEKQYSDGSQAYLFKNNKDECLQILWSDNVKLETKIPLPTGTEVKLIQIDGESKSLTATKGSISVKVSNEPILLLYQQQDPKLGEE